jgi:rRNA maturation RNase YbeY
MLTISNTTKRKRLPALPFSDIADKVLGKKYDLSLVFIGHAKSRTLNRTYRGKDKPTNVLSFPYEKNSGEIFIDLAKVQAELKKFDSTFEYHLGYLFIHGVLHLKGMDHGSIMDKAEAKLIRLFLNAQTNHHRSRHRDITDSHCRLRI